MALVLEFSLPTGRSWRWLYLVYLRHVLPVFGARLSGNLAAYRYLSARIQAFPASGGKNRARRAVASFASASVRRAACCEIWDGW